MITIISQSYFSQAFTGQLLCSIFFIVIKKSCCCKFHIACFHETEWCSHSCHLKNNSSLPTHKTTPHISKKSIRFLILIIFEVTSSAKLKQFENIHISNEFKKNSTSHIINALTITYFNGYNFFTIDGAC